MNILYKAQIIIYFLINSINSFQPIKFDNDLKLCVNCKYFQKIEYLPIESGYCKLFTLPNELGNCKLFTLKKNYVSGNNLCIPAFIARDQENLCGKDGIHYSDKNIITVDEIKENIE